MPRDSGIGFPKWLAWSAVLACACPVVVAGEADRSPVDLALTADTRWVVTANQSASTVSLVDAAAGMVVHEVAVGKLPAGISLTPDEARVVVTCASDGSLWVLRLDAGSATLGHVGAVQLGFEPRGVVVAPDGRTAYVALAAGAAVAVVDLVSLAEVCRIGVGRWPRSLALSADGSRLAVAASGDQSIGVIDTQAKQLLFESKFGGLNAGQLQISRDGLYAYFPWMVYRHNPIDPGNIRAGWVLGSRIGRVRLDKSTLREAFTLDVRGEAVSDPYGLALTSDEEWLVASASGTHELLVYRMRNLVFQSTGGPGDHIDGALLGNPERFFRVGLGGRPMAIRLAGDDRRVFVANYLANAVQVVDLETQDVQSIHLGGPAEPSLARRGEAIFYDGRRSLDQWYSCHSCHYEGGTNAVAMDTLNDGTVRTFKTVLPLRNVVDTGPWTWHGWQTDLRAAMRKSLVETMQGPQPSDGDVEALIAYLETLEEPCSPFLADDEAAIRGRQVFESEKAGCARCHHGPHFTDGEVHDVGLGSEKDVYEGFNTPSLLGLNSRIRLLHDGRGKSLEAVLTGPHDPKNVTGGEGLTAEELADLIEYLKTL
jgi:DNA-binding beta-propeller fold protein YncE